MSQWLADMHKLHTLAALLPLTALAQSWAPIGAKWTYSQGYVSSPDSNLAIINAVGDTLLGGRTYTRLEVQGGWFTCHAFLPYFAANADTVWFWDTYQEQEQVLFRWDALPGESWSTPISVFENIFDTLEWTVLDTGHVQVDGSWLRQLFVEVISAQGLLDPVNQGLITERLGGSTAPFTWTLGPCDAEIFNHLRCYEDAEVQWHHPMIPGCALGLPTTVRFDDPDAIWHVADTRPQGGPQDPSFIATTTTRYFYAGDTTIAGETWRRMWAQATTDPPPTALFEGLVRQVNDLVLFMDTLATLDTLYDFGIQIGDSVRYTMQGLADLYLNVVSLDSLLIQDVYHKVIQFDTSDALQTLESFVSGRWIEGVGSIHGPLAPIRVEDLEDWYFMDSTRTICYRQDGPVLWQHPDFPECTVNILLGTAATAKPEVRVLPNPASHLIRVQGLPRGNWAWRVIDARGATELEGRTSGTDPCAIDVRSLTTGIHVLWISAPVPIHLRFVKE